MKTTIGAAFAIYVIRFGDAKEIANAASAITLLVILAICPIFFAALMQSNKKNLEKEAIKKKIGSLYLGLRVTTVWQRFYSTVFLLRRLLYAVLTITCIHNPNILIHVFLLTNLIYIVYLGMSGPHDTHLARRLEYINESGLQFISYHLALFPLSPTPEDEFMLGWSMIGCIGLLFASNLIVMLVVSMGTLRSKLYLRKLRRRHEAAIELRKEEQSKQALKAWAERSSFVSETTTHN